jgi:hypothetical protein
MHLRNPHILATYHSTSLKFYSNFPRAFTSHYLPITFLKSKPALPYTPQLKSLRKIIPITKNILAPSLGLS